MRSLDSNGSGHDLTRLLRQVQAGEQDTWDKVLAIVYRDLRAMARRSLSAERRDHTMQATALVHEAYLRLVHADGAGFDCRGHFFAACATTIRRILVEHERRRRRQKRGAGWRRIGLDAGAVVAGSPDVDMVALDEALTRLAVIDPLRAQVVELRYFAGMTVKETAAFVGVSVPTVVRAWRLSKAWLYRELHDDT